jgi:hypothetical protein
VASAILVVLKRIKALYKLVIALYKASELILLLLLLYIKVKSY